jgi:hypothetical protein
MSDDQPTCGRGLAAHSDLPRVLGELTEAVADVLESHLGMLDRTDAVAELEHGAYVELVAEHRVAAHQLAAAAGHMAGYRDLPMGRHVDSREANALMAGAFARLVRLEEELVALLQRRLAEDRAMLEAMH